MKNEQTRQPYVAGALVKLSKKVIEEVKKHGKDIITEPTAGQKKIEPLTKKQRAYRKGTRNAAVGGAGIYAGTESLLSEPTEEEVYEDTPINYTVADLPEEGAMIIEKNEKDVTYINKDFEKAAKSAKGSTFIYDDTEYETKAALEALKRLKKAEGGAVEEDEDMNVNNFRMMRKSFLEEYARAKTPEKKQALQKNFTMQTENFDDDTKLKVFKEEQKQRNKKAEGGSLMVPPEMEMEEEEMPEDTYDNIPEDEMAEAEASQKPDDIMQKDYMSYILTESLDAEEQQYLTQVLEGDEQLSAILDKVLMTASEFSGAGPVEGPGTGVSDSIPARLSDGEFVMTKKATDQIGADELQKMMDEAEKAYDGGLMKKKAQGGLLSSPTKPQMSSDDEEIKKAMLGANRMPSLRAY